MAARNHTFPVRSTNGGDADSRLGWSSESRGGGGDHRGSCVVAGKPRELRGREELCGEVCLWPEEILLAANLKIVVLDTNFICLLTLIGCDNTYGNR